MVCTKHVEQHNTRNVNIPIFLGNYPYFLKWVLRLTAGIGALFALIPFVSSWKPSAKVQRESGPVSVDLTSMAPGQQKTVMWRGKPIWIIRRTPEMIAQLKNEQFLKDPDSHDSLQPRGALNPFRALNPEYAVLVGLCTHLGCIPKMMATAAGVKHPSGAAHFFCPCHGSTFDLAGRVYRDAPASTNLEVPPYHFISDHVLMIGEDA